MKNNQHVTKPLVSIIVPVYHTRDYLAKCIDSILAQTYKNLEVVLVDDGGEDGSAEICDRYAERDVRVRVIHQGNCGVARSRIRGVHESQGSYIMFVDSDDYILPSMVETMMETLRKYKADVVMCQANRIDGNKRFPVVERPKPGVYDRKRIIDLLKTQALYNPKTGYAGVSFEVWGKLYARSSIEPFMSQGAGLWFEEDMVIVFSILNIIRAMVVLPNRFYQYIVRNGQATRIYKPDIVKNFIATFERLISVDKNRYLETQLPYRALVEAGRILSICEKQPKGKTLFIRAFYEIVGNNIISRLLCQDVTMPNVSLKIKRFLLSHHYGNLYYAMLHLKHGVK